MLKHLQTKVMLLLGLMLAGAGSAWAEDYEKTYTFTTTTATGWTSSATTDAAKNYAKMKSGEGVEAPIATLVSTGEVLSSALQVNVTAGTFGTWNGTKQVTVTAALLDSEGTVLSSANYTKSSLTNSESAYLADDYPISVALPASPSQVAKVKITFTMPNTSDVLRFKNLKLKYSTAIAGPDAPTFSVSEGSVAYGTSVTLTAPKGCAVYYTTDGSDPTTSTTAKDSDEENTVQVTIDEDMTIKAVSFDGDAFSTIASATYTLVRPAAPTISEASGAVEAGTEVTITAASGCALYYTTDGSAPNSTGAIEVETGTATVVVNSAMTIRAISVDDNLLESAETTATYTIATLTDPTFTVADMALEVGDQKAPTVTTESEGDVTYTSDNTAVATIVDGKVNAVAKGTATITASLAKSGNYRAATTTFTVTVTVPAVWESTSKGIDKITYDMFEYTNETSNIIYTEFSGKSGTSTAVYAGNAGKKSGLGFIQIRTKNSDEGIVTTTSGGKARKVVIDWNSAPSNGRNLQVYGKNSAYSAASDLYSKEKQGTLLGTLTQNVTTLKINGDYEYIGVRSNDGAIYLNHITIYWEGDAVILSDATDYTPQAVDYATVTLGRSLAEGWNGVVLPFDLTTDVQTALGATVVKTLGTATAEGDAVTLNFVDATLPVAAGTPVLVKLSEAMASGDVKVVGVELKNATPTAVVLTAADNTFTLTGTYTTETLTDSEAYFVAGSAFYHKAAGVALTAKPFRSYIVQEAVGEARAVRFNLGGETTGITDMQAGTQANTTWHDLQGRKVTAPGKGLYIVNGKKIIK